MRRVKGTDKDHKSRIKVIITVRDFKTVIIRIMDIELLKDILTVSLYNISL